MAMSSVERAGIHLEQAAVHLEGASSALARLRMGGGGGGDGGGIQAGPAGAGGWLWPYMQSLLAGQQARSHVGGGAAVPGGGSAGGLSGEAKNAMLFGLSKAGAGGVALMVASLGLDLLGDQVKKAAGSMEALARAGLTVNREFLTLASPNVAGTMKGSEDMLKSRLGSYDVQTAEARSRAMQMVAQLMDKVPADVQAGIGKAKARMALGAEGEKAGQQFMSNTPLPLGNAIGTVIGGIIGRQVADSNGPVKRSMTGLPQPEITSGERFWEQAAVSSLAMGSNTIEQDLYRRQLEELQKIGGILAEIRNQPLPSFPVYR